MKKNSSRGFSLAELVISSAILVFIVGSLALNFQTFSRASTDNSMQTKVNYKLQSVLEEVRMEVYENFHLASEVDRDRTGTFDANIKVYSSISDVNNANRTREISVRAVYENAFKTIESSRSITMVHLREEMDGTQLTIKAINPYTNAPVEGVTVSAPGQKSPTVECVTDQYGICAIFGALVSSHGIDVKADGTLVRHYFLAGGEDGLTPSFYKKYQSGPTLSGDHNREFYDSPVEIIPPSRVEGNVFDHANNNGVSNATVFIAKEDGSQIIDFDIPETEKTTLTDSNGRYVIDGIIPGRYFLYMFGSETHAALGKPNDDWDGGVNAPNSFYVDVHSVYNHTDFRTLEKGTLIFTVKGAAPKTGSPGEFEEGSPFANERVHIPNPYSSYVYPGRTTYHVQGSTKYRHYLSESMAWEEFFMDPANKHFGPAMTVVRETDSNGTVTIPHFGPIILSLDAPLTDQYHEIGILTRKNDYPWLTGDERIDIPEPHTPVVVEGPLNNPSLYFPRPHIYSDGAYWPDGDRNQGADVVRELYPAQTVTSDFYLMETSALGKLTMTARWAPGTPNAGQVVPFSNYSLSGIQSEFGNGTVDILDDGAPKNMGWSNGAEGTAYNHQAHHGLWWGSVMPEDFDESSYYNPTLGKSHCPTLIPGNDHVISYWSFAGIGHSHYANLDGHFRAFRKVFDGTNVVMEPVPEEELDVTNVPIWTGNGKVNYLGEYDLIDGHIDVSHLAVKRFSTYYSTTSVNFLLGNDAHAEFEIPASPNTFHYYGPNMSIDAPSGYTFLRHPNHTINLFGVMGGDYLYRTAYYYPEDGVLKLTSSSYGIQMFKIGQSGLIYGRVVNATTGEKMLGVRVTLNRSGKMPDGLTPLPDLEYTTVEDACGVAGLSCGANDYQFVFNDVDFAMWYGYNLTLSVSVPGYDAVSESVQGYEDIEWNRNFSILAVAGSGPAGDL